MLEWKIWRGLEIWDIYSSSFQSKPLVLFCALLTSVTLRPYQQGMAIHTEIIMIILIAMYVYVSLKTPQSFIRILLYCSIYTFFWTLKNNSPISLHLLYIHKTYFTLCQLSDTLKTCKLKKYQFCNTSRFPERS